MKTEYTNQLQRDIYIREGNTHKPTPSSTVDLEREVMTDKQPQTCYVKCEKCDDGIYIDLIAGCCNNPNEDGSRCGNPIPVKVQERCSNCRTTGYVEIQNIYIHTPEELQALKAEWQREAAEKAWHEAKKGDLYLYEHLDQHYPLPQPPKP